MSVKHIRISQRKRERSLTKSKSSKINNLKNLNYQAMMRKSKMPALMEKCQLQTSQLSKNKQFKRADDYENFNKSRIIFTGLGSLPLGRFQFLDRISFVNLVKSNKKKSSSKNKIC